MRSFVAFWLVAITLFAMPDNYWAYKEQFRIKQNEFASWEVNKNIFFVRWSLFHNKQLVTIMKYDNFPYQTILYNDYKLNSFKIPVKVTDTVTPPLPYIMVVFENFDEQEKVANMALYLFDQKQTVEIKRAE